MLCGVERFYILVLVLEKLPLLFEADFKFGYSFLAREISPLAY
jgi:hypothetical protein